MIAEREPTKAEYAQHECRQRAEYASAQMVKLFAFIRSNNGLAVDETCDRILDAISDVKASSSEM